MSGVYWSVISWRCEARLWLVESRCPRLVNGFCEFKNSQCLQSVPEEKRHQITADPARKSRDNYRSRVPYLDVTENQSLYSPVIITTFTHTMRTTVLLVLLGLLVAATFTNTEANFYGKRGRWIKISRVSSLMPLIGVFAIYPKNLTWR